MTTYRIRRAIPAGAKHSWQMIRPAGACSGYLVGAIIRMGVWMKWESGCQPARREAALRDGKSLGERDAVVPVVLGEGDVDTAQLSGSPGPSGGSDRVLLQGKLAGGSSTRSCTARPGINELMQAGIDFCNLSALPY